MSADELRRAAEAERSEWGGPDNARTYPRAAAIHLALADCLEQTATSVDMTEESLHEGVFGLEFALARAINGSAT